MLGAVLALGLTASAAPASPYAEARSSAGPIELTLRVLNRKKSPKDALLYQVELRNIGKLPLLLADRAFQEPVWISQNSRQKRATYLDVLMPSKRVPANARPSYDYHSEEHGAETGKSSRPAVEPLDLAPGNSAFVSCGKPVEQHGRRWCPLDFWLLYEPGVHRVRAVHKGAPSGGRAPGYPEDVDVATPWVSFEVAK